MREGKKDTPSLIVIGGGAAGIFCAINAARFSPTLKITILEKTNKVLSKVKVSGGGRCNVTHACFNIDELVKNYPRGERLLKKAFHWFNPQHTINWFEDRGILLKEEADGRVFPTTDNSQTIIDCLLKEVSKYRINLLLKEDVIEIRKEDKKFILRTDNNNIYNADYVCVASGGYPKSTQFEWLTQIGHTIATPVPSLFTFNILDKALHQLSGVSVENVTVKVANSKQLVSEGALLITHWGLSGPAILKLSSFGAKQFAEKDYNFKITINWLPIYHEQELSVYFQQLRSELKAQKISHKNPFVLPARLWQYLLAISEVNEETRWADLPSKQQNNLITNLVAQPFTISGKTTFKEEFVTCGGINLSEINANTMESKIVPNLFFAGEIMDVDGITGGYNFQHAWTSGWLAAKAIAG